MTLQENRSRSYFWTLAAPLAMLLSFAPLGFAGCGSDSTTGSDAATATGGSSGSAGSSGSSGGSTGNAGTGGRASTGGSTGSGSGGSTGTGAGGNTFGGGGRGAGGRSAIDFDGGLPDGFSFDGGMGNFDAAGLDVNLATCDSTATAGASCTAFGACTTTAGFCFCDGTTWMCQ